MSEAETGLFIAVVGPDGVGKTSLADRVVEAGRGRALYFHFCPTGDQPLRPFVHLGDEPIPPPAPEEGSFAVSVARLVRNLIRFWSAYLLHIRPARSRGNLVVGDRWAFGYQASPQYVRYYGPAWLAKAAVAAFPQPDLILNLTAAPAVIAARKDDLTVDEIERELRGWGSLDDTRRVDVDASPDLESIVEDVLRIIEEAGWSR